jgi:hypothetical protein
MTDAEFKKLVAETMDYISKHRGNKRHYYNLGYRKLRDRWPKGCRDCGREDTEFFMANNEVWIKASRIGTKHGVLCLSCFEKRLGRPMRDSDIPGGITDEYDEGMTVSEWRERTGK